MLELDQDDLWLVEELEADEPSELLRTMPELRQYAAIPRGDEEVGLRSLLDVPEAQSKAWWRDANTRKRHTPKNVKRHPHALRAA
jgi:predicted glycosyltransferase